MIAKTIFEQIGGRRFAAMTGSKDFIDMGNGLRMSLARNKTCANRLDIIYDAGADLYNMRFYRKTFSKKTFVFTKNGYHFNGSKVDRRFSYSKIDAALQRNRYKERMELASTANGNGLGLANTPTPSVTGHGEFFSGSLGLLNGSSSYNAADAEANQEMAEILRRKKKAKRKRGLGL